MTIPRDHCPRHVVLPLESLEPALCRGGRDPAEERARTAAWIAGVAVCATL